MVNSIIINYDMEIRCKDSNFSWNRLPILDEKLKHFEKILQITNWVPKMNSPWLEYEKWYITSWYTVKPDFCPILPDFSGKNRIPDPENRIPDPEIYLC